jgi:apoptosis-inducing factor 2
MKDMAGAARHTETRPRVVVVGGGYGGARAARMLDDAAEVVLVEPKDAFVHNAAALRGLVDQDWTERIFLPYERLLRRGRVVRDRATEVGSDAVLLASGERIDADYIVLATGSTYPFPAKLEEDDSASARARIAEARAALTDSGRVLLFGAGPVGLELAGEIRAAWPQKEIVVLDPAEDVLSGGYTAELRAELRRQLRAMGVELRLGTAPAVQPATPPATAGGVEVVTVGGEQIRADLWFRCFGAATASGYLTAELAAAQTSDGRLQVTPELRVVGQEAVFAIGDLTAIPEPKQAAVADVHGQVAAANIAALIRGEAELKAYEPEKDPAILIPLGPDGGASHLPGGMVGSDITATYKGKDLLVSDYRAMFGLDAPQL